jgi:hypothetical protein
MILTPLPSRVFCSKAYPFPKESWADVGKLVRNKDIPNIIPFRIVYFFMSKIEFVYENKS